MEQEKMDQAMEYIKEDRLLDAANILKELPAESLENEHISTLKRAGMVEEVISSHLLEAPPEEEGWTKLSESHNPKRDTLIFYKVGESNKLWVRIETPIEPTLLVPLLSVWNESDLYDTWMPRWTFPFHLGVKSSEKLQQIGRCGQVCAVKIAMPWPVADREVIYECFAVDAIDIKGVIPIRAVSVNSKDDEDDDSPPSLSALSPQEMKKLVPPVEDGVKRIDFDGGFLFRKCPTDHPSLKNSKRGEAEGSQNDLILLTHTMTANPHVSYVPDALINFTTRTVIGTMWESMMQIAEKVRDGKLPQHTEAISNNRELYDWIDERIQHMFAVLNEKDEAEESEGMEDGTKDQQNEQVNEEK